MNSEMELTCRITVAARKAIHDGVQPQFYPGPSVNSVSFALQPEKWTGKPQAVIVRGVEAWFAQCRAKMLQDVKFLCPTDVSEEYLLRFPNIAMGGILCIYPGSTTLLTSNRHYDPARKVWDVMYTEFYFGPGAIVPRFEDQSVAFMQTLEELREFAIWLDFKYFARIFHRAAMLLEGDEVAPADDEILPELPPDKLPLYRAARLADVFGAIGSWNDSPLCEARAKGQMNTYDNLSTELLRNLRLALLFAINEW